MTHVIIDGVSIRVKEETLRSLHSSLLEFHKQNPKIVDYEISGGKSNIWFSVKAVNKGGINHGSHQGSRKVDKVKVKGGEVGK